MKRAINSKKIMAIIAIVALVAILGVCLVACNQSDYEKRLKDKGYTIASLSAEQLGVDESKIEWFISATKGEFSINSIGFESVTIVKFAKSDDAKDYEAALKKKATKGSKVERSGSIVIAGTEQGVKDAK